MAAEGRSNDSRVSRGISPFRWGPSAWVFIHYVALGYPEAPTPRDAAEYRAFFGSLPFVLPCRECREHLAQNLSALPPDEALSSGREALFRWSVDLHNLVNEQLGRPPRDATVMERWFRSHRLVPLPDITRVADAALGAACAAGVLATVIGAMFIFRASENRK